MAPRANTATSRDSSNELYDRGCDLLIAAQGIRRAAAQPEAAVAIVATLGCVEAALDALAHATAAMRREADRRAGDDARQSFTDLVDALQDASLAADELRQRTGAVLARLTIESP